MVQCFEHAGLGGGEQLAQGIEVVATGSGQFEGDAEIEAKHVAGGADAEMILDTAHDLPNLMLFERLCRVLPVGAEQEAWSGGAATGITKTSVQADTASGAGDALLSAALAVLRPSARPEVPAAEGPDAFFAALSST